MTTYKGLYWCYTSFVNVDLEKPVVPDNQCTYRVEGLETCPTTQKLHKQCFVAFKQRKTLTGVRKYDGQCNWTELYKNSTPAQAAEYCKKDGNFTEFGDPPKDKQEKVKKQDAFAEAMAAPTYTEAIEVIKQKRPRDYVLHGEAIERNLKKVKRNPITIKYTADKFNIPLQQFTDKAIFIQGPSGIGKTQYAKAHFTNPLLVSHMDKLKELTPDHDGIIFDDMSFTHLPSQAVIHLLDWEEDREIHVRYAFATIPAETKKIFTHNSDQIFYDNNCPSERVEAIKRRYTHVMLINKLF